MEASYQLAIDAAPLAPTAVVRGATASGTTTTATFGGEVNPGGIPTNYRFQYGTTPSYGSETTAASAGAVRTPVAVSQSVAGLTPGTTYHWRLVASSAAGEAFSPNQTLTTIPNPPTAGTGRGLATGPRSLRLTGTASTGGAAGTAFFEYGPTAKFGFATAPVAVNGAAAQVQIDLRGLRRDTVYFYRLVVDTAGGRGLGKNLSVRTGDQNQVIASIDAPIASVGSVFTVPRFRANVRIVGPTGRTIRSAAALRRVQVHVLCTRGCRVNQRFSLRRSTVSLRSALGTGVPVAIRTTPRGATIDLSRLFAAYQFTAGAEIQLRLTGAGLRGSASVVTLKSVARRLRCALRDNRPVQCEIP